MKDFNIKQTIARSHECNCTYNTLTYAKSNIAELATIAPKTACRLEAIVANGKPPCLINKIITLKLLNLLVHGKILE